MKWENILEIFCIGDILMLTVYRWHISEDPKNVDFFFFSFNLIVCYCHQIVCYISSFDDFQQKWRSLLYFLYLKCVQYQKISSIDTKTGLKILFLHNIRSGFGLIEAWHLFKWHNNIMDEKREALSNCVELFTSLFFFIFLYFSFIYVFAVLICMNDKIVWHFKWIFSRRFFFFSNTPLIVNYSICVI